MQRGLCVALAALLLSACNLKPEAIASPASDAVLNVPKATKRLMPSTLPIMTTPGTWLHPPAGPLFEEMDTLDPRHAMVYIYRPSTSWEDQELQAPSFFVNGTKVFGLKSGSYTWMEIHAGKYQFYAKRPLSILYIKKIFELDLSLLGGKTYFLRYSEGAPFNYKAEGLKPEDFMHDGFLQEVPASVALAEIGPMKMDHPGLYFASGRVVQERWAPFESFPETGYDPAEVAALEDEKKRRKEEGLLARAKLVFTEPGAALRKTGEFLTSPKEMMRVPGEMLRKSRDLMRKSGESIRNTTKTLKDMF